MSQIMEGNSAAFLDDLSF